MDIQHAIHYSVIIIGSIILSRECFRAARSEWLQDATRKMILYAASVYFLAKVFFYFTEGMGWTS